MTYASNQLAKAADKLETARARILEAALTEDEHSFRYWAPKLRYWTDEAQRFASAVEAEDRSYRETYPTNPEAV